MNVPNLYLFQSEEIRANILASGCALLFAMLINLIFTVMIQVFGIWTNDNPNFAHKFRDGVTRHLFLFGVGCLLSTCVMPGLNGPFNSILAWLCLLVVLVLHIAFVVSRENIAKVRSIVTVVFYSLIAIWYFGIMVSFFKLSTGLMNR